MPKSVYHPRVDLKSFDAAFRGIAERNYTRGDVTSLFDAWSIEKLRAKCDLAGVKKVPTDIVVWGRGPGSHDCTTRVGGLPAWTPGEKLPGQSKRAGSSKTGLKFFGQFNLTDSADLLPPLPGGLLSVWGTDDFPWEPKSVKTFWLDPAVARTVQGVAEEIVMPFEFSEPFSGSLYRTWDPEPDQELPSVPVDHQFESYREYSPEAWTATKMGGFEKMPQLGSNARAGRFILQFCSIQAAPSVPFPWTTHKKPLGLGSDKSGIYHQKNCLVLGDLGAISFCLKRNGEVTTLFECG